MHSHFIQVWINACRQFQMLSMFGFVATTLKLQFAVMKSVWKAKNLLVFFFNIFPILNYLIN